MRIALYFLLAANFSIALTACGQSPQLFKVSEPVKKEPTTPAVAKIGDDISAIKAWWNELHGDGSEIRIVEMKPRMKPKDFEIKYDSGHPAGPYWLNCEEFLEKSRDPEADKESVLYPLRSGASGAHAFSAKISSAKHPADSALWMFVIARGEVIYSTSSFRMVR